MKTILLVGRSLFCAILFLIAVRPVSGQVEGSISGTVLDPNGKPAANVTVSLIRPGSATPLISTETNEHGVFTINSLTPVTYGIAIVSNIGSLSENDVAVRPGQPTVLRNLVLRDNTPNVDPLASQRTDRAEEGVQTTDTQIASTLEIPQLELLPQSLRDPLQLLDTQAGVFTNNGASTIDGLRPSLINVTIDGVNAQDTPNRAGTLNYLPSRPFLDQVSEFTLVTSNETSKFGYGAAQAAFATPSGMSQPLGATPQGQNNFHGDLFYLVSPSVTNSNEWFSSANGVRTDFLRNQGGATLGGSLKKDKIFFYANYELLRYKDESPETVYSLSPAGISLIPASDSTLLNLVKALPLPTTLYDSYFGSTITRQAYRQNLDNFTGKLDIYASAKNSVALSYLLSHDRSNPYTGNDKFSTASLNEPTLQSNDLRHLGSLSWRTSALSFVNELRVGVSDLPVVYAPVGGFPSTSISVFYSGVAQAEGLISQYIGLKCQVASCNTSQTIGVTANPLASVPPTFGDESSRSSRAYNAQDNASWNHLRHSVQFGFQFQRLQTSFQDQYSTISLGDVEFETPGTAFGPVFCVNGTGPCGLSFGNLPTINYELLPNGSGYSLGPFKPSRFEQNTFAFYGQDTFRISPRLTAIMGLRYELNRAPSETDGQFLQPTVGNQNIVSALLDPSTAFSFSGAPVYRNRYRDFAPNAGLAFDPTGKGVTVIRAGYSIAYGNDDLLSALSAAQPKLSYLEVANQTATSLNASPVFNPVNISGTLTAISLQQLATSINSATNPYGDFGFANVIGIGGVDPNLRTPYVNQWNFDIQHSWKGTVFDLRYLGNHAVGLLRQLNINQMNLNGADSAGHTFLSDFAAYNASSPAATTFASNCAAPDYNTNTPKCSSLVSSGFAGQAAAIYGSGYNLYSNPYARTGVNLLGNFSHSTFHAFQLDINHRFGSHLQFQANYSFAKVLSDSADATTGNSAITKIEFFRSAANPQLDYGPASFDIRHSIKINFYYLLPVENMLRSGVAKATLGGWSVSSIIIRQSGTPFSIDSNVPTSDYRGSNPPPFTTADAPGGVQNLISIRETPCGVFFVAASALATPNNSGNGCSTVVNNSILRNPIAGQVGSLQPRSFYNPWASEVNLGIQKTFPFTERQSVRIRFEAVNLFNHASWYVPDDSNSDNINAPMISGPNGTTFGNTFGHVLSTLYPSRKMQFTILYRF